MLMTESVSGIQPTIQRLCILPMSQGDWIRINVCILRPRALTAILPELDGTALQPVPESYKVGEPRLADMVLVSSAAGATGFNAAVGPNAEERLMNRRSTVQ